MIMLVPYLQTGSSFAGNNAIDSVTVLYYPAVTLSSISPIITQIPASPVLSESTLRTTPFIREVEGEIFWVPMFLLSGATDNNYIDYALATTSNTGDISPTGTELVCDYST
jgi:hypothetical protein